VAVHVPGQLIPPPVTVPLPVTLTVSVKRWLGTSKVAVTVFAMLIVTVQVVPEAVSHPLQPLKVDPLAGAAVSVTLAPLS
jgi:hypothetical protein